MIKAGIIIIHIKGVFKMSQVAAYIQQLQQIEKTHSYMEFTQQPISLQQIENLEQLHGIQLNQDIKEILLTVGCTYWGFQDMDWEWIELSNIACRRDYTDEARKNIVTESFVFSDDGAGNPILIMNDGTIYILYHDDEGFERLSQSIPTIMEDFITSLND